MKQKEAETKWCPFSKPGDDVDTCVTEGCMAWCWDNKRSREGHCELINFPPVTVLSGNASLHRADAPAAGPSGSDC